jgi:hypothetical protein
MKTNSFIIGMIACTLVFASCESAENQETEPETEVQTEDSSESEDSESENVMSIEEIDQLRAEIESLEIAPVEVMTTNARAKIKQKWSKMHFYVQDGEIVKIKTYPHTEISNRTEEFYVKDGQLALVVIEDDGSGTKGKAKNEIDKMYYFSNGKLLVESKTDDKSEYTIKESDPEELMSEFGEYLEIYNKIPA